MSHRRTRSTDLAEIGAKTASVSQRSLGTGSLAEWWRQRPNLAAWLLFALVALAFLPALQNDFVAYDDNGYVTENAWVKEGMTWAGVTRAFQTTEIAYWHPLTWASHMVDVELFGLRPWGHHLTSLLWHAANAALLFVVLRGLTGAAGASWVVAALFGLHPLHVESVAWVAERKDVLSTFFSLVALAAYARWVRERRTGWYVGALAAFALGLMSKPMVVTLPCLMLLLDFWPLGRWKADTRWREVLQRAGRLVVEKVPFFVLSAAASVAAVKAQASLGTLQSTATYGIGVRMGNALVAYLEYLGKCFWPVDLAVFYPHPGSQPWAIMGAAGLGLGAITGVGVWQVRRRPWLAVGWCWFLGLLVPVIGLVQVGGQAMADRYSYLSLVGIFIVAIWLANEVTSGWPRWGRVMLAGFVLSACLVQTQRQLAIWRNSESLFEHALAVTERNWVAHYALGYHYSKNPATLDQSIEHYRETVRITPGAAEAHFSLAAMLARRAESREEAVAEFREALRIAPGNLEAQLGLGQVLQRLPGRAAEAVAVLEHARRSAPGDRALATALSGAYVALGQAETARGTRDVEAIAAFRAAIGAAPDNADAHLRLADELVARAETIDEAVNEYREVLRLRPDWVEVRNNLGLAYLAKPATLEAAIAEFEVLLRERPNFVEAHANLANALAKLPARADEAEREYRATLSLRAGDFRDHFNYGVFLLNRSGREAEAIAQFEAALRLRPDLAPAQQILRQLRAGQ